ncbi:glycosyltransferase [Anaerofustis sp. HA2171]|uniref:glycosyltransferase n=1 Tax=Anaerofustis butyriciformans TaxID=3108533 RepID=UPI002E338E2B|nr:glycosyltransferase [Anaerofustis sp. HA2171]
MNKYIVKIKNLTFRRALNKVISLIREIPLRVSISTIEKTNEHIYEDLDGFLNDFPYSNQCDYYKKSDMYIGIITDEFMFNYYKDAVNLMAITPDNYKELIDQKKVDCLLYVSCWHGMVDDEWYGEERHKKICDVFDYANKQGIPTIFQTIEDPISYDRFLPIAKNSKYIFTSCAEVVEKYKSDTKNENVYTLEYGINPLFHNPVGLRRKEKFSGKLPKTMFAGSWMDVYKQRCRDMRMIFDGILDSGESLLIADRNINVKLPGYKYPRKYYGLTVPAIEHEKLQKVHKLFDFNINVNTVKDSKSMCAMRVYELQALGCIMLSNYALAVSENFPGLFIVNNKEEVKYILNGYSKKELYRMQVDNLRNVMTDCTVYDRLNYIFEKCNINEFFEKRKVAVVCFKESEQIKTMFDSQTYKNTTLICLKDYIENKQALDDLKKTFESYDYIVPFCEKYNYGRYYITDLINAFKYVDTPVITKNDSLDFEQYNFANCTTSIYLSALKKYVFVEYILSVIEENKLEDIDNLNIQKQMFLLDGFGVETSDDTSIKKEDQEKELAVIVPVYNNGKYLIGRCFRSLLRSSIFDKMQIYLVDDGSTDTKTYDIIDELSKRYSNVTTYYFNDGGSGSASRPRNKGVEISNEPYITYLDPDNEAISDGYAKLLEKIKEYNCDMTFGSILTVKKDVEKMGFLFKDSYIKNPKQTLIKEKFRPQSVQACVIKRELIEKNEIENVVGSYGEDTLFFYELILCSKNIFYLDCPIHIYYAERTDSSVNKINKRFFEKSFILEKEQVKKLEKYNVLDEYKKKRLDYFFINWYLEKLKIVNCEERKQSYIILKNIIELYGKDMKDYIKQGEDF